MRKECRDRSRGGEIHSGSSVAFRLGDVVCPDLGQIIAHIGPDVRVCGEVAFLSDRGGEKAYFAIVSASGIDTPLIVPVAELELFTGRRLVGREGWLEVGGRDEGQRDSASATEPERKGER